MRFPAFIFSVLLALCPVWGQDVTTVDGRTFSGDIFLDGGQIVVRSATGVARIEAGNIAVANFPQPVYLNAGKPPTAPIPADHGAFVEFYPDRYMRAVLFSRVDPTINIDLRTSADARAREVGGVRWLATLTPMVTGTYVFSAEMDGIMRVWVNHKLVYSYWDLPSQQRLSEPIYLDGGKPVPLRVEYATQGLRSAKVLWAVDQGRKQLIPASCLTPGNVDERRALVRGVGLRGEYFEDQTFATRVMVRRDDLIDFQWFWRTNRWPDAAVPEHFAARWTGFIAPPADGEYTLYLLADDGARLFIDGQLIVDAWTTPAMREQSGEFTFKSGQKYAIKIEQNNRNGGHAQIKFSWAGAGLPKQVVGPEYFSPPAGDPGVMPEARLEISEQDCFPASEAIELKAAPWVDAGDKIKRVEFILDGNVIGTREDAPWRMQLKNPPLGEHWAAVRVVDQGDLASAIAPVPILVGAGMAGLPDGKWLHARIGDGAADSLSGDKQGYTASAAPGDIWSKGNDAFHYIFRPLDGDGCLIARINSLTPDKAGTVAAMAAGIMIRDGLAPNGRHVSLLVSADGNTCTAGFIYRDKVGGDVTYSGANAKMPVWLKMQRVGNHVNAYTSEDGKQWTAAGKILFNLSAHAYIGVAVAGKGDGGAVAGFDHLEFQAGKPAMFCNVAGIELRDGSVLAGEVRRANAETVKFYFHGSERTFDTTQIARLLFQPITSEIMAAAPAGRVGVILQSGDFEEGEFSGVAGEKVSMTSVIFGPQQFSTTDGALAVLLRDVTPKPGYEITAADGSVYRTDSIQIQNGRLLFKSVVGDMMMPTPDLVKIARVK